MLRSPILAAVLCLTALTLTAAGAEEPDFATLTVQGSGEVRAKPDMATVRLGATVQAEDASKAQEQVNAIMQKTLAALKELGIPEDHIQTAGISLHPVYQHDRPRPAEATEPKITGYRASNTVEVRVENLAKTGDVIDVAVEQGANELQGVSFQLKNDTPQRTEALKKAVAEARQKAQALAAAAEVTLGPVFRLDEQSVNVIYPQARLGMAAGRAMEAATPVQPGEITVNAAVTLTYRIAQPAP